MLLEHTIFRLKISLFIGMGSLDLKKVILHRKKFVTLEQKCELFEKGKDALVSKRT